MSSGAGTNLKVGEGVRTNVGAPIRRKVPEKYFGRAPPLFGSMSTISPFGERFRDGQYSLVSFLFAVFLLTVSTHCPGYSYNVLFMSLFVVVYVCKFSDDDDRELLNGELVRSISCVLRRSFGNV